MKEIHGIDLSSLQIIKLKSVNFSSKTDSLSMEVTNHSFSGIQRIEVILTKKRPIIEFEPMNQGSTDKNRMIPDRAVPSWS